MLTSLSQHLPTIIGATVVFSVVLLIVAKQVRDRKNHKSGCGCGCSHCANSDSCHPH